MCWIKNRFQIHNRSGDELFGTEETIHSPYSLNPTHAISQVELYLAPTTTPISQHVDIYVDEHAIVKSLYLSNTLFLEEPLDQAGLPTILEEYPKPQCESDN